MALANMGDDPKIETADPPVVVPDVEQATPHRLVTRASSTQGLMIICITATAQMVDNML